jgi:hypothetical protein
MRDGRRHSMRLSQFIEQNVENHRYVMGNIRARDDGACTDHVPLALRDHPSQILLAIAKVRANSFQSRPCCW